MKRIRHTRLHFQEGNSDKVYEVDLLQLSDSDYLVNFRYGKRGGTLKEGTKTEKALAFDAAAKIYKSLVVSKLNKGYELESGFDPLEQDLTAPVPKSLPNPDKIPNAVHILQRLEAFTQPSPVFSRISAKGEPYIRGHALSRTVWQAVQYRLPEVLNFLPVLMTSHHAPLNFSLVWALGKFGHAGHLPALAELETRLPVSMTYLVDEVRSQWSEPLAVKMPLPDFGAELAICQDALEKLGAYQRYESLSVRKLIPTAFDNFKQVLRWRGAETPLLELLHSAPIEQEWLEFFQALPATLRETIESDRSRYEDLRKAVNALLSDWLHGLKLQALPHYVADKALYQQIISQVPLDEFTTYAYYQDCLRRGQLGWLYGDIQRQLGNYINRQRLIPTDYEPFDAHALLSRIQTYTRFDEIETHPLTETERAAAWQVLTHYQCHQAVRAGFSQIPTQINVQFFRNQAWHFAETHLPPENLSQFQGNLHAAVEALFYAYRSHKREALLAHRESERLAIEVQILALSRQMQQWPESRQGFLQLMADMPLSKDTFPLLRKLLKLAEYRADWELLAVLYHKLEAHPPLSGNFGYAGRDSRHPLTPATRNYFRRRMVRLLKTLAEHQPEAYIPLAVSILKQIEDDDAYFAAKTETLSRYYETDEGYQRRTRRREFPAFSSHLALGYLLWQGSRLYQFDRKALKWLKSESFNSDVDFPEAHPELWRGAPEQLCDLLLSARAEIVNDFALARFSAQTAYCEGLSLEMRLALLKRPYLNTARFAAESLTSELPETQVLAAFLDSPFAEIRCLALPHLRAAWLLEHRDVLARLLCSGHVDVQAHLRSLEALFPVLDASFTDQVLDQLFVLEQEAVDLSALFDSVVYFLRDALQARISISALQRLMASSSHFFQRLALELLAASSYRYDELDAFPALLQASTFADVQAGAIRLLAKLPVSAQLRQLPTLVQALWHEDRAFREAAAKLLTSLIQQEPHAVYLPEIWQALYPAFFQATPEALRMEILAWVAVLSPFFAQISAEQVWALLTGRSKLAQQVGGQVITAQSGQDYSLAQLVQLTKNPCLSARNWALAVLQSDPRSLSEPQLLLLILDNPWDETRLAAVDFFRGLHPSFWTPEWVIAVCDQVYADVQSFGRELVMASFQAGQGPVYLQALSQHPSRAMQLFVSGFLESELHQTLEQEPEQILALEPFFRGVLLQVNQGRVLKDRVLRFLTRAALTLREAPAVANMVHVLFSQMVLTTVQADKAQLIAALYALQQAYPELETPLKMIGPRKVTP